MDVGEFGDRMQSASIKKVEMLQRIAFLVERHSKEVTPVAIGTLKRSIYTKVDPNGAWALVGTNLDTDSGSRVGYPTYVHNGTSKMAARPFFTWGMAASRDTAIQMMKDSGMRFLNELKG